MQKISTTKLLTACIAFITILGGALAIYATANGPWGLTDPVVYISVARSILQGHGLGYYEANTVYNPLTFFPPFISIVLSLIGLFKVDLVAAMRWLNIFSFMTSIFISGWIFVRYSRTPALGIISSALMCVFPGMIMIFSSSFSEPVFICLLMAGGMFVLEYFQRKRQRDFILGAILIGFVPLTRYAGIAMLAAAILTMFLFANGHVRSRLRQIFLFVLIACLPIAVWSVNLYFVFNNSIMRRGYNLDFGNLTQKFQDFRALFMDTFWAWIPFQSAQSPLAYSMRWVMLIAAVLIITVICLVALRRLRQTAQKEEPFNGLQIWIFFGISALAFLGFVIATYLFTSPTIDIDNRMLLPFFVCIVMSLLGAFSIWQLSWFTGKLRWLQLIPWLIAAVCLYWYVPQSIEKAQLYQPGYGLTAFKWDSSETVRAVRSLPGNQPVISNDWELLLLWTGRPIYGFWNTFPAQPLQTMPYGTNSADRVQTVFCKQGAALVIFSDFSKQASGRVGEANLQQFSGLFNGLSVYGQYLDGVIYLCP